MPRLLVWCLLAIALGCVTVAPAWAHASLLSSDPADDTVLRQAPQSLILTFTEAVEPQLLRLFDHSGGSRDLTAIERRGNDLVITAPQPMTPGLQVLSWRVVSSDGHPISGSVVFFIGQREAATITAGTDTSTSVRAFLWLCRLLVYLGLFVGCGGAFFVSWVAVERTAATRAIALAIAVSFPVLVIATGFQGLDLLGEPTSSLMSSAVWRAALASSFGNFVVCTSIALIAAALALRQAGATARGVAVVALFGVGLALASTGHAATASPRWLMLPAIFVHGVGLAFWVGALLPLGLAMRSASPQSTATLSNFSRLIPFAVLPAIAAGIVLAVVQLGQFQAIFTTDYGRLFLMKMLLVAALLLLAAINRYVLTTKAEQGIAPARRRLRQSIAIELVVVLAIFAVSGLWRFTPPPRSLVAAQDSFFTHLHTDKAMASVTILPARPGANEILVQLETVDERPLAAKELQITLSNPGAGIEPIMRSASLSGDGKWHARVDLPIAGRWVIGLEILVSDFDKVTVEVPILINPTPLR